MKKFLDDGVGNNWKNDRYNWSREIVVVTGGSDGIGAKIVAMLATKGIKTVVLDIQEPKYIRECSLPAVLVLHECRTQRVCDVRTNKLSSQFHQTSTTSTATLAPRTPSKRPAQLSSPKSATPPSSSTTPASRAARPSSKPQTTTCASPSKSTPSATTSSRSNFCPA